jgi:hypothetical protein
MRLDGKTLSGNKFSDSIGQQLSDAELHMKRPVNIEPVPTSLKPPADNIMADISNNQRILLEYMLGVSSEEVAEEFVYRKLGPVSHARWLTTASRILMLYTRAEEPSDVLRLLVLFCTSRESTTKSGSRLKRTNPSPRVPASCLISERR